MAQIRIGRLVKGPKINQYVGTVSHLLFNYRIVYCYFLPSLKLTVRP